MDTACKSYFTFILHFADVPVDKRHATMYLKKRTSKVMTITGMYTGPTPRMMHLFIELLRHRCEWSRSLFCLLNRLPGLNFFVSISCSSSFSLPLYLFVSMNTSNYSSLQWTLQTTLRFNGHFKLLFPNYTYVKFSAFLSASLTCLGFQHRQSHHFQRRWQKRLRCCVRGIHDYLQYFLTRT
jgi:hypothetical protein